MPPSQVSASDRPWPLRALAGLFRAAASLQLAVVLIAAMATVLAWATFVESHYGDSSRAVYFGIYGAWWFLGLNALLGLNVLCAALVRLPWRRRHLGFLITHAGILVLLVGCWQTYRGGLFASLPVCEGTSEWRAYKDSQCLELEIARDGADKTETVRIPFVGGPFNWAELDAKFWFPWALAHRDRGVVYDRDGVKLEALDYYSDSEFVPVPNLSLYVASPGRRSLGVGHGGVQSEKVELAFSGSPSPGGPNRRELASGHRLVFLMAQTPQATKAFLESAPEGPLGERGQVVFFVGGKRHVVKVDGLEEGKPQPLGDSGWTVELVQYIDALPALQLAVRTDRPEPARMMLLADHPELNRSSDDRIVATYWAKAAQPSDGAAGPHSAAGLAERARRPRIDILQGDDQKLYYRAWKAPELVALAPLPADGRPVEMFAGSDAAVRVQVAGFTPAERPGTAPRPVAFDGDRNAAQNTRQVRLRLTVDGRSREFWLAGMSFGQSVGPDLPPEYRRTVRGEGREVAVTMPRDQVDLGFRVYLDKFWRKFDPGSRAVSEYSSVVDFCDRDEPDKRLQEDVLVTLNQPASFSDPTSGRSYRLYQNSFGGPFRPGDQVFEQNVGGRAMRDRVFVSYLDVNYDPGRGIKYFGSLLICLGIAVTIYQKTSSRAKRKTARV